MMGTPFFCAKDLVQVPFEIHRFALDDRRTLNGSFFCSRGEVFGINWLTIQYV